ncbi:DsbA family oxidoreductase [Pedobacter metabolipauper]|uniref:Putative DsbA family dithiol-disulfide isomerase n=1 Tax=Pedobacter metabolipauper TaxID=425513 RepID=A0A4R6SR62_9SPHI|nr:DsbA family oxidoreductase [Pedobacter metabolipauper]TDQ06912.1 putative DsbA family dithiol-disulfide isomerase [Pedobacter metabolipauper]
MKVDIWSDVRCPFCYIGKRKFEAALAQFEHKDKVEVEWHSFELDPNAETMPGVSPYDYLAKRYGKSREWAVETHQQVAQTAAAVGLKFNFDISVVANSFDAHRLIQLAKSNDLGDEVEEQLFVAYFTSGKDISNHQTLVEIGTGIGLNKLSIETMLSSDEFTDEVRYDEQMAQNIGIQGVPFFIFNQKLAVSGAQPPETFLGAMKQVWESQ